MAVHLDPPWPSQAQEQGAASEVEQLGFILVPLWNAGLTSGVLTCCATACLHLKELQEESALLWTGSLPSGHSKPEASSCSGLPAVCAGAHTLGLLCFFQAVRGAGGQVGQPALRCCLDGCAGVTGRAFIWCTTR